MKKIIFYAISFGVGAALFIGVIWHVGPASILETLNSFSISKWFVVLAINALQIIVTMYRWQLILKSQGYAVSLNKLIGAKLVGFTADYLTPSPNVGGEAIRSYVLKKDAQVPFAQGLASVIIDKIADFSYALPFVLFGIFYVLFEFSLSWKIIAGLLFISLAFIFLLGLFYYKILFLRKAYFSSIIRFLQLHRFSFMTRAMNKIGEFELIIINFFHHDRRTFYRCLGLSVISGILGIGGFWMILYFFGIHANLLQVLIIATLNIITFLLPIPGSFGSTETGLALVFSLLGFKAEQGLAFTLISRSVDLLKVAFGLLYFSHFGLRISQTIIKGEGIKDHNGNGQPPLPNT